MHNYTEDSEKEQDFVDLGDDIEGERDLCGSFNEEEALDYREVVSDETESPEVEEGEINSEEEEEQSDDELEIQMCVKSRNLEKLKRILQKKEVECKKLEKAMQREKQREKEDKEMKALLERINKASKTKKSLQKSLAASRTTSPIASPKQQQKPSSKQSKGTAPKSACKASSSGTKKRIKEDKSEYNQVFESFMKLKQGSSDYGEIVANAMNATDNILTLKGGKHTGVRKFKGKECGKVGQASNSVKANNKEALFKVLDKYTNNSSNNTIASTLLSVLDKDTDSELECDASPQKKVVNMLDTLKRFLTKHNNEEGDNDQVVDSSNENNEPRKAKKLVSGRCTKPDDSDIQMVVKYAHEKLDAKHVSDRRFDALPFNFLIAGELEIALLPNITQEEQEARIDIARTLSYHKKYLDDSHLRDEYDSILKQVEQGIITWMDGLGNKLHDFLDYRANVLLRDRIAAQDNTGARQKGDGKKIGAEHKSDSNKEKIYYCLDYNLNKCSNPDKHEGQFGSKTVVKHHICRRCHREGEYRKHRDSDDACPYRAA